MKAAESPNTGLTRVRELFGLDTLERPVDLFGLARQWGVSSIDEEPIGSEAMLLPSGDGYRVVLKKSNSQAAMLRQRFSFAHELGHLLLRSSGFESRTNLVAKHRSDVQKNEEERMCDKIASEILLPRNAFIDDTQARGWSLRSLNGLAKLYQASITATALRMVGLTDQPLAMAIWKPRRGPVDSHRLQQAFSSSYRYGVPNTKFVPHRRLWIIGRSLNSHGVASGIAPIVFKDRGTPLPTDVPAEAWAWGMNEFRRVMVYYYPELGLSDEMVAVANATR